MRQKVTSKPCLDTKYICSKSGKNISAKTNKMNAEKCRIIRTLEGKGKGETSFVKSIDDGIYFTFAMLLSNFSR